MMDDAKIKTLVDRFLAWPLPKSVLCDGCVVMRDYPHSRSGTNLLTADEARQMVEYLFASERPATEKDNQMSLEDKLRKLIDAYRYVHINNLDRVLVLNDLEKLLQKDPVLIERERCALIADNFKDVYAGIGGRTRSLLREVAAEIRKEPGE